MLEGGPAESGGKPMILRSCPLKPVPRSKPRNTLNPRIAGQDADEIDDDSVLTLLGLGKMVQLGSLLFGSDELKATEFRKQISIFLPVSDWRALRNEAARQGVPITELCRRWIGPEIARLRCDPRRERA